MNSSTENSRASILIADDDEIVRDIMRAVLEGGGFAVVEAVDGKDALKCCEASVPDLLISDVAMPGLDGFALCREIRQTSSMAHLPILMATGLGDRESIARAYDCGATDFISKPINWDALPYRVRYILRAAKAFDTLRSSHDALTAANEAKSNFLALIGHELRTPLNAIIGFSTIMRDEMFGPMPEAYTTYPGEIAESGEHLLSIINSVLVVANAEEDRLTLDQRHFDVNELAGYALRLFDSQAKAADIRLSVELEDGLPPLYGDLAKLRQIVINLVSNAIKFTPQGGQVRLRVWLDPANALIISVEDTGIGIEPEQIETAMSPFGQIDSGLERKYEGMGLGLPISQRLIELHGGSLSIESEVGRGTVVTVCLPDDAQFAAADG